MTERNRWPKKFAEALADDFMLDATHTRLTVFGWLIESLSDQQRTTYYFIDIQYKTEPVTAADVAYAYHLKLNHASGLLKSLYELGLLQRELVVDSTGKRYVYRRVTP